MTKRKRLLQPVAGMPGDRAMPGTEGTEAPEVVPGPGPGPEAEEVLSLTPIEMMRLQLLESQMRMQDALVDKFTFQIQLTKIEHDARIRDMDTRARQCRDSKGKLAKEYNDQLRAVEERLGIKMADYTVREDGSLFLPGPPAGPVS